jgi:NDP-sugar pyrophosphorylase family protein
MSPARNVNAMSAVSALVLAGGFGTRSRPVLGDTPKLLAPLADRPYLDYLIAWLKQSGVRRVTLALGHLANQVVDFLSANPYRDIEVSYVIETKPLGTAGAIAFARPFLPGTPVLVLNGDSYVSVDINKFLQFHLDNEFEGSLVCTEVEDAARFGGVAFDENNRITGFREKAPSTSERGYINAGVYLLGPSLLDKISDLGEGSIEHDIFSASPGPLLGAYHGRFDFIDFGTPESYAEAQRFFADLPVSETH